MMIRIFTFSIALLVAFGVKAQDVDSIYIETVSYTHLTLPTKRIV